MTKYSVKKYFYPATIIVLLCIVVYGGKKGAQTVLDNQCHSYIESGVSKLKTEAKCGSEQISYELADGSNKNPLNRFNKSCFLFDKEGAGLTPCGYYKKTGSCPARVLSSLAVGEVGCGYILYAGDFGGRLYTTVADSGMTPWTVTYTPTSAISVDNGKFNTDILKTVGGKPAAQMCTRIGPEWYLPALYELDHLWKTFDKTNGFKDAFYWSSTDTDDHGAWMELFRNGSKWGGIRPYGVVRCVRR